MGMIEIITASMAFMDSFTKLMPILAKMKAEGRTAFSADEWAIVESSLDKSEMKAVAAVDAL